MPVIEVVINTEDRKHQACVRITHVPETILEVEEIMEDKMKETEIS